MNNIKQLKKEYIEYLAMTKLCQEACAFEEWLEGHELAEWLEREGEK